MEVTGTSFEGLLVLTPRIFSDDRGHFLETWNDRAFRSEIGREITFVQDNESVSHQNVLRGLHLQLEPCAQGKLIHVIHGSVVDVVVDIRPEIATFGQHFKIELDAISKQMLFIPPGFAHGFLALENNTIFAYKCTKPYDNSSERTILWNDPDLGIDWGVKEPIVSAKDAQGILFHGNWDR
ncbi:MAG: dTDP-4-dehydrorhamnose 3,5-epimerase [Bacteroidota bacterium]|nr:dTDP-4-dehydrorhamnose 3,5-epimerase [Bacteroidota bacterium]